MQEFPEATVRSGGVVVLNVVVPAGFKLNEAAPHRLLLEDLSSKQRVAVLKPKDFRIVQLDLKKIPPTSSQARLHGTLYICAIKDSQICMSLKVGQKLHVAPQGGNQALEWKLRLPASGGASTDGSAVR